VRLPVITILAVRRFLIVLLLRAAAAEAPPRVLWNFRLFGCWSRACVVESLETVCIVNMRRILCGWTDTTWVGAFQRLFDSHYYPDIALRRVISSCC